MSNLQEHGVNTQLLTEDSILFVDSQTGSIGDALCRAVRQDVETYTGVIKNRAVEKRAALIEELNQSVKCHFNSLLSRGYAA